MRWFVAGSAVSESMIDLVNSLPEDTAICGSFQGLLCAALHALERCDLCELYFAVVLKFKYSVILQGFGVL